MKILNQDYKVIKDYGNTISLVDFNEVVTEYYETFDYIVGDWAYGKLRLKGFYENDNKKVKNYNNIDNVEDYINNCCAYGCKYFILKKDKNNIIEN